MTSKEAYNYLLGLLESGGDMRWSLVKESMDKFKELVDKATPKKPKYELSEHCHIDELCPVCNRTVASYDNYCGKCGQRIGGLRS